MNLPLTRPDVRVTPRIKQHIVNWLLSDEEVRIPAGVKFGPNSVTVGSPTADDIQFDADGGLAQQDGTVVLSLPNDGSVSIEQASINGHEAQDPRDLVTYVDLTDQGSISEVIASGLDRTIEDRYHVLEILRYQDDDADADTDLTLTAGGIGDGNYNFTLVDETGTFSRVTGANQFTLIRPTATNSLDAHSAIFEIFTTELRIAVMGRGAPTVRGQGQYLFATDTTTGLDSAFDLTLAASPASDNVDLKAALWEVDQRGDITP